MKAEEQLIAELKEQKASLALAESVTGGRVSSLLTGIPGASQVFSFGAIVYSLQAKHDLFGLSLSGLKSSQGVSRKTASELAERVRKFAKTDFGAAIVGFAGPSAPEGKKGLIYMAVSSRGKCSEKKIIFTGSRTRIQDKAGKALLKFILKEVKE